MNQNVDIELTRAAEERKIQANVIGENRWKKPKVLSKKNSATH